MSGVGYLCGTISGWTVKAESKYMSVVSGEVQFIELIWNRIPLRTYVFVIHLVHFRVFWLQQMNNFQFI